MEIRNFLKNSIMLLVLLTILMSVSYADDVPQRGISIEEISAPVDTPPQEEAEIVAIDESGQINWPAVSLVVILLGIVVIIGSLVFLSGNKKED